MKIVMINGQNHKGSTYHIGRSLAEKVGGEITEFFLPRDFSDICLGCNRCFMEDENLCLHHEKLAPIIQKMDEADLLIFTSPVYVYHVTGAMKVFLDHFGYRWLVHRPEETMFQKQAVCITTAAGAGMKSTLQDMADSLFFWGVPKIYRMGYAIHAVSYTEISPKTKAKIEKKSDRLAKIIQKNRTQLSPGLKTKFYFYLMRLFMKKGWNGVDEEYWKNKGWLEKVRPWNKPA